MRKPYSKKEDKIILQEIKKEKSTYIQIAKKLDRSRNSIISRCKILKVKPRYFERKYNDKEIFEFYKTHTAKECAEKFNIHYTIIMSCVERYLREHPKIKRKDKRRKDAWSVREYKYMLNNLGLVEKSEIAKKLKRGCWRCIKEKSQQLQLSHTKYINGLPYSLACVLLNIPENNRNRVLKTTGKGKFKIVTYEELLKHKIKNQKIKKCIKTMLIFKEFINKDEKK